MDLDTPITKVEKDKVYKETVDIIIDSLKKALIFEEDSQQCAEYILEQLEKTTTKRELLSFLDSLSRKWDIFLPVYQSFKKDELIEKVQGELEKIQSQATS